MALQRQWKDSYQKCSERKKEAFKSHLKFLVRVLFFAKGIGSILGLLFFPTSQTVPLKYGKIEVSRDKNCRAISKFTRLL